MSLELFDRIVRYASLFGIGMIIFLMVDKYFAVDEPLDSTTKLELELYSLGKKIDSVNIEIKTLNVQADKISNQVNNTLVNVKQIKKQRDEKVHYVSHLSDSASFVFFASWISQDYSSGE